MQLYATTEDKYFRIFRDSELRALFVGATKFGVLLLFPLCIFLLFLAVKSCGEHVCIYYLPNYVLLPYFSCYYNESLYLCVINFTTTNKK